MPTYNNGAFLDTAVNSVLKQTIRDFELIIVDNFSTDNTSKIIRNFKDKRIKYFKFKNKGIIAASRNLGISKSKGKYLAFIDSDDKWYENKLEVCLNYFKVNSKFLFHLMDTKKDNKIYYNKKIIKNNIFDFKKILLNGNVIATSSVVLKKDLITKFGSFSENENIVTAEDFELWLRILKSCNTGFFIPKSLGYLREHSNNSSSNIEKRINAAISAIKINLKYCNTSKRKYNLLKKSIALIYYSNSFASLKKGDIKKFFLYLKKGFEKDPLKFFSYVFNIFSLSLPK